jgi:tight adherence protein B
VGGRDRSVSWARWLSEWPTPTQMTQMLIVWLVLVVAIECGRRALMGFQGSRTIELALLHRYSEAESALDQVDLGSWSVVRKRRFVSARTRTHLLAAGAGLLAGLSGERLVGPLGLVIGVVVGAMLPRTLSERRAGKLKLDLEKQLAEVADSAAMAVRSGLSIVQATEFAAEEAITPMAEVLSRFIQDQRLGTPFEEALYGFADEIGSPDAKLFALVVAIHARSGGNLAGALDEVSSTIRHRIAVRRELRALSAQGRISGSVLGALPIAFFLVLAATSQHDLAPVYRSSPGIAMISAGLVMEGLAFVWIRRLLRVEV